MNAPTEEPYKVNWFKVSLTASIIAALAVMAALHLRPSLGISVIVGAIVLVFMLKRDPSLIYLKLAASTAGVYLSLSFSAAIAGSVEFEFASAWPVYFSSDGKLTLGKVGSELHVAAVVLITVFVLADLKLRRCLDIGLGLSQLTPAQKTDLLCCAFGVVLSLVSVFRTTSDWAAFVSVWGCLLLLGLCAFKSFSE